MIFFYCPTTFNVTGIGKFKSLIPVFFFKRILLVSPGKKPEGTLILALSASQRLLGKCDCVFCCRYTVSARAQSTHRITLCEHEHLLSGNNKVCAPVIWAALPYTVCPHSTHQP